MHCDIYKYADDNTISASHSEKAELVKVLENKSQEAIEWFHSNAMLANPEKFQAILLSPWRAESLSEELSFHGVSIRNENTVNVLGIKLDDKLSFNDHIKHLCMKAGRQLNVLRRLSPYLDQTSRLAIFKSFISAHFNDCPMVWHNCGKTNMAKLERLQERCLRFVYKDHKSDYESLVKKANLTTLTLSHIRLVAIEVYKALKGHSPSYMSQLFTVRSESAPKIRAENTLDIPIKRSVRFGKYSLSYEGAKIWNHLPNHIRKAENFNQFRNLIKTWEGCNCALCIAK